MEAARRLIVKMWSLRGVEVRNSCWKVVHNAIC
jgi:hypothetical protein